MPTHAEEKKVLRQSLGGFSSKLVGAALTFLGSILIARQLGPQNFGVYSLVLSLSGVAGLVISFGLPALLVRDVSSSVIKQQWDEVKGLLFGSYQCAAIVFFVLIVLVVFAMSLFGNERYWLLGAIGLVYAGVVGVNQIRGGFLRGLHLVVLADIPDLLVRPGMLVLFVSGLTLTGVAWNPNIAIMTQLVAAISSLLLGVILVVRYVPRELLDATPKRPDGKQWLSNAPTFLVVTLLSAVEQQMPLYLLGWILSSREAGLYQVAAQLVNLVAFGLLAVNMSLQPRISVAWTQQNFAVAQQLMRTSVRLGTLVALIGGGLLFFFADSVLAIFGGGYIEAASVLRVLVVGQMINALAGSCGVMLMMSGHQREAVVGLLFAVLVCVLLGSVCIPIFSLMGAVIAAVGSLLTWNLYMSVRAFQLTGVDTTVMCLGKSVGYGK